MSSSGWAAADGHASSARRAATRDRLAQDALTVRSRHVLERVQA